MILNQICDEDFDLEAPFLKPTSTIPGQVCCIHRSVLARNQINSGPRRSQVTGQSRNERCHLSHHRFCIFCPADYSVMLLPPSDQTGGIELFMSDRHCNGGNSYEIHEAREKAIRAVPHGTATPCSSATTSPPRSTALPTSRMARTITGTTASRRRAGAAISVCARPMC
jgi:hypothetical protein